MAEQEKSFVYILTNKRCNVLYTGVTNNLSRRLWEHRNKSNEGFSSKYNTSRLVYYETYDQISDAILREKMIKKKSRRGKVLLIESINKGWEDLSDGF